MGQAFISISCNCFLLCSFSFYFQNEKRKRQRKIKLYNQFFIIWAIFDLFKSVIYQNGSGREGWLAVLGLLRAFFFLKKQNSLNNTKYYIRFLKKKNYKKMAYPAIKSPHPLFIFKWKLFSWATKEIGQEKSR